MKHIAGEAGHLAAAKKPNSMVRDYLDSTRGRHLHDATTRPFARIAVGTVKGKSPADRADDYIKKDFGEFKKKYDPAKFA